LREPRSEPASPAVQSRPAPALEGRTALRLGCRPPTSVVRHVAPPATPAQQSETSPVRGILRASGSGSHGNRRESRRVKGGAPDAPPLRQEV
jgi:hypothetical protein